MTKEIRSKSQCPLFGDVSACTDSPECPLCVPLRKHRKKAKKAEIRRRAVVIQEKETEEIDTRSPEFIAYINARNRCTFIGDRAWKHYGGRGIKFKFRSFERFMLELGKRPPGKSLDRINNDGHYEPGNVRWATMKEQAANRRPIQRRMVSEILAVLLDSKEQL